MEIAKVIEEKKDKEEDLINIRTVEEIVPKWFHKYLKVFEKKESEKMPTRKIWDHTIDLREEFVLKKREDISIVKNRERKSAGVHKISVKKRIY